jgi:superfamily II DNA or RNA helicase
MFSRYKIGLSGTIERKDQKHVVFKDYFGSKLFKPDKENTMVPEVHVINSGIYFSDSSGASWAEKINVLKESYLYKDLVVALADKYASEGHKVITVSDRVEFLRACNHNSTYPSDLIIGEVKDRDEIIRKIFEDEIDQVWGTQSLVSEGLSINPLSCLILATPLNNMPLLEQLIGRIIREYPDKLKPVIVDIRLEGNTVSRQYNNRLGHYMKEGYEIKFIK